MFYTTLKKIKYILGITIFVGSFVSNLSLASAASYTADNLIDLTNQARAQNGLGTLQVNSKLASAALAKAEDMLNKDYFAHNSPDGKTPWDFINQSGYNYIYAGENLGIGYSEANELFSDWMNSPTHRDNILGSNYHEIGIAVVSGEFQGSETIIAVQEFGTASPSTTPEQVASQLATPTPSTSESAQATPGSQNYEIIRDKTSFSPQSIFAGEEIEFKVTLKGEVKSLEAQVFNEKYNLLESPSASGSNAEKTYNLRQKIEQIGSTNVQIMAIGADSQKQVIDLGSLQVKQTVIAKTQNQPQGLIGQLKTSLSNYWYVYVIFLGLVAGVTAYYMYSKKNKYSNFSFNFWRA